eukprot:5503283-Amphidinium_carterae.1
MCRSHFCPAGARVALTRAGRVVTIMSRWQERGNQGWYKKPTRHGGRKDRPYMQNYGSTLQGVDSRGRSLAAVGRAERQNDRNAWRRKQHNRQMPTNGEDNANQEVRQREKHQQMMGRAHRRDHALHNLRNIAPRGVRQPTSSTSQQAGGPHQSASGADQQPHSRL